MHFYQIWIFPDKAGLRPTYDQKSFVPTAWRNRLFPVASGQNLPGTVTFHTDATIYRCELDKGLEVTLKYTTGRRIFVYLTKGRLSTNGNSMDSKDQARIDIDEPLVLKADEQADFILIDVPSCKGWGYTAETLQGQKK